MVEIIEYSLPTSWQRVQEFVPQNKSVLEILEFWQQIELGENLPRVVPTKSSKKDKKQSQEHDTDNGHKDGMTRDSTKAHNCNKKQKVERTEYCHLQNTSSHDFSKCKVMLEQAQRLHGQLEAQYQPNNPTT